MPPLQYAAPVVKRCQCGLIWLRLPTLKAWWSSVIAAFGGVDILINNVGGGRGVRFADSTDADLAFTLDVNLIAAVAPVRSVSAVDAPARRRTDCHHLVDLGP